MGDGWHQGTMGGGWWVLIVIGMVVFLAVFVVGAVLLVRHYGEPHSEIESFELSHRHPQAAIRPGPDLRGGVHTQPGTAQRPAVSRRTAVWMLVVGAIGVIVLGAVLAFGPGGGRFGGGQTLTLSKCQPKTTSGTVVNVTLSDRGGGMMGGGSPMMVSLAATPSSVPSGSVTFVATNTGALNHELLILPLPSDGAGTRPVRTDGKIDEQRSSSGEASTSCGRGPGNGISPGTRSWMTVKLAPGRYELLCDEPWHYANGIFAEFTVS